MSCFLDNVVIYSKTREEPTEHIRQTLGAQEIDFHFLGHVVSKEGLSPNPTKIKSVKVWSNPKNKRDVQSFLSLCNYYRR